MPGPLLALVGVLGAGPSDTVPVRLAADDAPADAGSLVVFINFEGADVGNGIDDATADVSQIDELEGEFPEYGGDDTRREAILQAVRSHWERYDITVTDERPASGNYVMALVGPHNPIGGGVLGIAPVDCGNKQAPNVAFAFHGADDGHSAAATATTISHEVAHTFGLEHVSDAGAIMNPDNLGGDSEFFDECAALVSGTMCGEQHEEYCEAGGQNAHEELVRRFGAPSPDDDGGDSGVIVPTSRGGDDSGCAVGGRPRPRPPWLAWVVLLLLGVPKRCARLGGRAHRRHGTKGWVGTGLPFRQP